MRLVMPLFYFFGRQCRSLDGCRSAARGLREKGCVKIVSNKIGLKKFFLNFFSV